MNFYLNDTATTDIYTLSLHDALPISSIETTTGRPCTPRSPRSVAWARRTDGRADQLRARDRRLAVARSEEHTSELQSQFHLVCRLLLEKKKFLTARLRRSVAVVVNAL